MKIHPIKELERRLARGGERLFPRFIQAVRELAESSIEERDGVLFLGHSPEIAPEAYCHTLYPAMKDDVIHDKLFRFMPLPDELQSLYHIMNGATLFWGQIEIWGLRSEAGPVLLPAFDLVEESSKVSCDGRIAFASNNCGDTIWLDRLSRSVRIEPNDPGLHALNLSSIDEWLMFSKEISDGKSEI